MGRLPQPSDAARRPPPNGESARSKIGTQAKAVTITGRSRRTVRANGGYNERVDLEVVDRVIHRVLPRTAA